MPEENSTSPAERATKRPAGASNNAEPSLKKRAPYVARACDACRRRKGRCSGGDPCVYCEERSLSCTATATGIDAASGSDVHDDSDHAVGDDFTAHSQPGPEPALGTLVQDNDEASGSQRSQASAILSREDVVSTLQQNGTWLSSQPNRLAGCASMSGDRLEDPTNAAGRSRIAAVSEPRDRTQSPLAYSGRGDRKLLGKHWYGPTSPHYSLDVAQKRLHKTRAGQFPSSGSGAGKDRDTQEESADDLQDGCVQWEKSSAWARDMAARYRQLLTKHESLRLMHKYQQSFGSLHPILRISKLADCIEALYDPACLSGVEENMNCQDARTARNGDVQLQTLSLVFSVALATERSERAAFSRDLLLSHRMAIVGQIATSAPAIENVVLALLMGAFHFCLGDPRLAWKMSGLAVNVLLELGLHNPNCYEQMREITNNHVQVAATIYSSIVLDRQWGAATGLPAHFQESNFHHVFDALDQLEAPYLKAMVSFIALSDRFTKPIARIAATSQPYEVDEEFKGLQKDIDEWRANAAGQYLFPPDGHWSLEALRTVPSWAILVHLRAINAHNMILRPFFFANHATLSARKHLRPAMELFSHSVSTIADLDQMTEVYQQQNPFYVHLLISACALMALVSTHVAQHYQDLKDDLPPPFHDKIRHSYTAAMGLAASYQEHCRASFKLARQLGLLSPTLVQLGILPFGGSNPKSGEGYTNTSEQQIPSTQPSFHFNFPQCAGLTCYQNTGHQAFEAEAMAPLNTQQGSGPMSHSRCKSGAGWNDPLSAYGAAYNSLHDLYGPAFTGHTMTAPNTADVGGPIEDRDTGMIQSALPASTLDPSFFQDWSLADDLTFL